MYTINIVSVLTVIGSHLLDVTLHSGPWCKCSQLNSKLAKPVCKHIHPVYIFNGVQTDDDDLMLIY